MSRKRINSDDLYHWLESGIDLKNRTIYLDDDIDTESVGTVVKALMTLESISNDPIKLIINSAGGDEIAGFTLYDFLTTCNSEIHTHGVGQVGSMALIVFMGGDIRTCSERCVFMNHAGSEELTGKPYEIETEFKMFKMREDWCNDILVERSKKPLDYWQRTARYKEVYYTKIEAYEVGIITEKE